jgi:hypothetical protein
MARFAQRRRHSVLVSVCAVLAATLVGACGGGGGSSSPPAPDLASAPGAAAINAYYSAAHSTTLSANVAGVPYTLTYTFVPISGPTTFPGTGQTVLSATESESITGGG